MLTDIEQNVLYNYGGMHSNAGMHNNARRHLCG